MIDSPHALLIHPELTDAPHERGVFEVPGHPHGWRQWLAYDTQGVIRLDIGMHGRDADTGLRDRLETRLDQFEERDRENAAYLSLTGGALDGGSSSP
jgi:hypothetical protein